MIETTPGTEVAFYARADGRLITSGEANGEGFISATIAAGDRVVLDFEEFDSPTVIIDGLEPERTFTWFGKPPRECSEMQVSWPLLAGAETYVLTSLGQTAASADAPPLSTCIQDAGLMVTASDADGQVVGVAVEEGPFTLDPIEVVAGFEPPIEVPTVVTPFAGQTREDLFVDRAFTTVTGIEYLFLGAVDGPATVPDVPGLVTLDVYERTAVRRAGFTRALVPGSVAVDLTANPLPRVTGLALVANRTTTLPLEGDPAGIGAVALIFPSSNIMYVAPYSSSTVTVPTVGELDLDDPEVIPVLLSTDDDYADTVSAYGVTTERTRPTSYFYSLFYPFS